MNTIELFCGTKSFSRVAEALGYETLTIDNDPQHKPDICTDILCWKPTGDPDIIWASPPCTCFSVASIGTHWGGGYRVYEPKSEAAKISLLVVKRTLEIIQELKPRYWFIENPRGVLRKLPIMSELPRKTVTYCQYGDSRMKPTDIWTNCDIWTPRLPCRNGDKCHDPAPRGSRTGTQGLKNAVDRSRIPHELFDEIFSVIER